MYTIFFDTETTGVPRDYKAPMSNVENWPRLVQLGYIVEVDGEQIHAIEHIIRPDGFQIPVEATAIHGITQNRAVEEGVPVADVLHEFATILAVCNKVIGHNVTFDINVLGAEYWRIHGENPFAGKLVVDTMALSTKFCALPGSYGNKWPKLGELFAKLFNAEMGMAHTALQDVENTVKCYHELVRLGVISLL